jgi:endonuclease YncB( thermonuclease family)
MKSHALFRYLLVIGLFVCLHKVATAATIQAKVIQVESGNSLLVTNISRALKIRLKAVAPPESAQPFSEAARDHLKSLVLDKTVVVEYTQLSDGYFAARVFLNGVDVGSQMLRDGAAWFDRSLEYTLSESDRELYARCEQLAREEKRGLWQDPASVAPWEFRKAQQAMKARAEVSFNSVRAAQTARAANRGRSFSNADLFGGMVGPGSVAGNPTLKPIWPNSAPGDWHMFQGQAPRFSIRFPGDSLQFQVPVLDDQKNIVNINYIIGSSDEAVYSLMWTSGSNDDVTGVDVADSTIQAFMDGMNSYFQSKGINARASASPGRAVRVGKFSGKEYTMTAGIISGAGRILSRQVGDQREVIAISVMGPGADWKSSGFLNSLRLVGN